MIRTIFLAAAMLMASTAALANIANPDLPNSKKAIDTTLVIQLDRNAKDARLIIPRSQIKQLRAELESLDAGSENTAAAISAESGFSGTQTIMSGLFISLATVFGGIWFVRSKRVSNIRGQATAAVAAVFAIGGFVMMAYGNAGPPAEARTITGKMFSPAVHMYGFGSGKIKLEVSDKERTPVLIVPNQKAETAVPVE
jgi:hypothetical protein